MTESIIIKNAIIILLSTMLVVGICCDAKKNQPQNKNNEASEIIMPATTFEMILKCRQYNSGDIECIMPAH